MVKDIVDDFIKSICSLFSKLNAIEREKMFPKPPLPVDYTPTERMIHKMLIENTGADILDSGDIYGRHWERNRAINDFRKIPKVSQEVYNDYISIKYNVFHYIVDHCEYCQELDKEFHKFANSPEYKEESWLTCMEDFCSEYLCLTKHKWCTINTYHYENILSQVLQYTMFTFDDFYDEAYIILQTHNGCDVRGGYSTPHVFRVFSFEYFDLAQVEYSAYCPQCHKDWFTDDAGYHWYSNDGNEIDITKEWIFDEHKNKVYHKKCNKEITFFVLDKY